MKGAVYMGKTMYTFKVRINGSEPLHKTITVMADTETVAESKAIAKITNDWAPAYSPGKDTLKLDLIQTI